MSDRGLPPLDEVRRRWAGLPKTGADEFIAHCKDRGNAEGITLPQRTVLRAAEPLHADRALLREVTFHEQVWGGMRLNGSGLYACTLRGVVCDPPAEWTTAHIVGCDLRNADLRAADFTGTIFNTTKLEGADLRGAILRNASFHNVSFDARTQLSDAIFDDATLDQHAFDQLVGALNLEQRRSIKIDSSPVARLDADFGRPGAVGTHLGLLVLFLAPYLGFLVTTWMSSKACPDGVACTTALEQLTDYALDRATKEGWLRLITGAICLAYNSLRVVLLIKAMRLRRARMRPNTTADIDYNHGRWPRVHDAAVKLFWINIGATVLHLLAWLVKPITLV